MFSFVSWQAWTWQQDEELWSLVGPPLTKCFPLFPGGTGPGNRMKGSGVGSNVGECLPLAVDKFLVGPPPTQCFPLFPGRTG